MSGLLIFVALKSELPEGVHGHEVVYTGVGKVNAALAAARAFERVRPGYAVNFGTAGAVTPGLSGLIKCGAAVQRDMDLRPMGLEAGVTFGDPEPALIRWGDGPVIGTGDSFVTSKPDIACDLVDMEAFALAKAALRYDVPFRALKFISDNADGGAADDWRANQARGAALFTDWLENANPLFPQGR